MKRSLQAIAAAFGLFAFAMPAHAQKPISIGVAAGATVPSGDLSDGANTGFNVTGTVGLHAPMMPIGLRADVAYNQLGMKGISESINVTSVTANATYSFPGIMVSPYLIAGLGWYHVGSSVSGSTSDNKFGFNGGVGARFALSGFSTFLEARYNKVNSDNGNFAYIPVTFGIMF